MIIFEKDNELIASTTTNKNALLQVAVNDRYEETRFVFQMEERMERERKVWNEHKDLIIAGERAKFEEEKTRLLKDLHDQVAMEQERSQRLEKKLYDAQMVRAQCLSSVVRPSSL